MDNKLQRQWVFEESFVNGNHAAAVCKEKVLPRWCVFSKDPNAKIFFSKVSFDTLLKHATVLTPLQDNALDAYKEFIAKPRRVSWS
ncbi:hypothetical protein TELCIR_06565 [Teladorsagia circumcincta]|uniref:Uncharacterized protein n=1 Tax=Teladorsagia circumcincta TaxID=45464 RepID=A0A2G9UMW3_TELCI|nr:hypothetical protein TELCIR_06565 [Teladorsagia circumcincta]